MLPILPALLLLFLQGPANLERLAHEGRLPAVIEAVQRLEGHDDPALAALLAASNATELSSALLAILQWSTQTPVKSPAREISTFVRLSDALVLTVQDGFSRSQRSRDGPSAVA